MTYDYCVVGGGIIGLSTAMQLIGRRPGASVLVLEKETRLAAHQTGHNSGVIHAGVYYAPGSLKATLCRRGAQATKDFCTEHGIPFEVCGKLLVATDAVESARMDGLETRARENGIATERLDAAELRRREPEVRGLGALFVPSTGIVDYRRICEAMARAVQAAGGVIRTGVAVTGIVERGGAVTIDTASGPIVARRLVVCAGLQSDRLARMAGFRIDHRILPFRGEYYRLPPGRSGIVRHLIYPVPDPDLPFLGIHLTRMIDGSVTVGPNAVLGLSREGYRKGAVNAADLLEAMGFRGTWRTLRQNWRAGVMEMRNSLFKRAYLEQCRKYCPSLGLEDLLPYEAGIRAQAVASDGSLIHDFLFLDSERMLHVCNAPSPGATSAIPIGEMIVDRLLARET